MPYNINDYKPFREGNHSAFPSSENGCRHIGNNTKRQYVRHFKVDGEVFRGPGEERCDYLLLNDEAATSYYIELKGSDLPKAIRQIENTIKLLSPSSPISPPFASVCLFIAPFVPDNSLSYFASIPSNP